VRNLSLGQRMRCELAACLLHQPDILFLDEPTIGLDLVGKQRFRELLVRLNEERATTIFLTSHDVADIEHVARRVIVINHGAVIYDDDVAAMRRSILSTKLVEISLEHPVAAPVFDGVSVTEQTASTLKLVVDTSRRPVRGVVDELLASLPVTDLSIVDPPLEQVIGSIYDTPRAVPGAGPVP
jgi:ABC-2 type transport system ATP-binding protein